ncbi:MAG: helix-hairpin-helix domain-containing protein [bacterium]|nr:helix-hairpin-helix domain-containing protein [bacterium]
MGSLLYGFKNNENLRDFLDFQVISPERAGTSRSPGLIKVSLKGCVRSPGEYYLVRGRRLKDLIERGKGILPYGDKERIDGSLFLTDGSEYYVPYRKLRDGERLNINRATEDELRMIPGVTKKIARQIVTYRTRYERFDEPEELKEVDGIGERKFFEMRKFIRTGEEQW